MTVASRTQDFAVIVSKIFLPDKIFLLWFTYLLRLKKVGWLKRFCSDRMKPNLLERYGCKIDGWPWKRTYEMYLLVVKILRPGNARMRGIYYLSGMSKAMCFVHWLRQICYRQWNSMDDVPCIATIGIELMMVSSLQPVKMKPTSLPNLRVIKKKKKNKDKAF